MTAILRAMTLDDVKDVLGRALIDGDFRQNLLNDPSEVLSVLGFQASQDSLNFFKALDSASFKGAAADIDNRLGGRPIIAAWL